MKHILHIGCGLVGKVIIGNLQKDYNVTVADINRENLNKIKKQYPKISTIVLDENNELLAKTLNETHFDLTVAAVTGKYAFSNAKTILNAGVSLCDISSFGPDDNIVNLNQIAKSNSCFCIPEIGIAPGMTNFLVGRGASLLDNIENVRIYVGGFPENPVQPFNYQATWSPSDVIQEYYSPARIIRNSELQIVRSLDDIHYIEFPPFGKLEAFITDGLGTLVHTIKADNMVEMTTRWPGHAAQMLLLRDMGLFEEKEVTLGGVKLVPRQILSDILIPMWKMNPDKGDRDILALRVIIDGKKDNKFVHRSWELVSKFDETTMQTAMSRCTGLTCAIFARAALEGKINQTGIIPPELLASSNDLYTYIMTKQAELGFNYSEEVITKELVHF